MRVSSNQILEAGVQSMDNSLADAMAWQKKISTGKNYSKASDNPYAVSRGVRLDFDVARLEMYKTNQNYVASTHAIAQSQMGTIIDELIVLKQAFVQSQNGILNSTNFKALKIQAEQIRDTIQSQMTAKDATGNAIFPEVVNNVQIEPNVTVKSGVQFTDAFNGGTIADPTQSGLYRKINDFVTYLDQRSTGSALTNSASSVETGLNDIFDRITTAQQRSGGIAAQVDISKEAMGTIGTEMAATASALLDTDLAAATAAYTRSQTLLNAAQAMFARLQQSSLFSKL
jgi:flagellin-like hook-associated protein FlgL